jgi:hypothetical protein
MASHKDARAGACQPKVISGLAAVAERLLKYRSRDRCLLL